MKFGWRSAAGAVALGATTAQAGFRDDLFSLGENLTHWNSGMIKFLQQDPLNGFTGCIRELEKTNVLVMDLFNLSTYANGEFDFFEGIDKYSIMTIELFTEFEACGFNGYLIAVDNMFSSWDTFAGAACNLVVDITLSFTVPSLHKSTPIVKAWDTYLIPAFQVDAFKDINWEQVGEGFMLTFS